MPPRKKKYQKYVPSYPTKLLNMILFHSPAFVSNNNYQRMTKHHKGKFQSTRLQQVNYNFHRNNKHGVLIHPKGNLWYYSVEKVNNVPYNAVTNVKINGKRYIARGYLGKVQ